MRRRLAVIALSLAAPILVGAAVFETAGGKTIEWMVASGPVDPPAVPDAREANGVQGLTAHEWGTFTSIAGPDGMGLEWLPAGGPTDLPCFVKVSGAGPKGLPVTAQGGRANKAMVRMETPVLYFYSLGEETVNVKVSFPRGLITEWFPDAVLGPGSSWNALTAYPNATSTIEWNNVRVRPGATESYPMDETQSHYYAARRTGSAPLQVLSPRNGQGDAFEKFLFYRGIAAFQAPLAARVTGDGRIEVTNLGQETIPGAVLFENRGGRIGFRILKGLGEQAVLLDSPELTQTFESLQPELEAMLREQGMYALEARAMVDTWKDSWFEQGTRIFYIVPSKTVDALLPLEIQPKPVDVARAFVGRLEVFTPATMKEVLLAVEKNDKAALSTYGRFLEPILHDFLKDNRADAQIASIRAAYVESVTACSKKLW